MAQMTQSNGVHLHGQSANATPHQPNESSSYSAADDSSQAGVAEQASTAPQAESAESAKLQNSLKARKRTKTGCLSESSCRI